MILILGTTGQVGSAVVRKLASGVETVRTVVRDESKAGYLKELGVNFTIADFFDGDALTKAFKGVDTVLLLTPENPASSDFLRDTKIILNNYRNAVKGSGVKRIIGLSSCGAQHDGGTGNLEASYMLEHAFDGLNIKQIFVRPSYYFSNWMGYYDLAKEQGILPTFFPVNFQIPMISPMSVGTLIAELVTGKLQLGDTISYNDVVEVTGPSAYSANNIANVLKKHLGKPVKATEIPRSEWQSTLEQAGFSPSGATNIMLMTDAVISGKTGFTRDPITTRTTFADYLKWITSSELSEPRN